MLQNYKKIQKRGKNMLKTITCVATVTKKRIVSIPKILYSRFNEEALKNIGFFCDFEKKIIILPVQQNSKRVKLGGSALVYCCNKPRPYTSCTCWLQKNTARALNLNYNDLVQIVAEYDENGEGRIVIEKYEDYEEAKHGNN